MKNSNLIHSSHFCSTSFKIVQKHQKHKTSSKKKAEYNRIYWNSYFENSSGSILSPYTLIFVRCHFLKKCFYLNLSKEGWSSAWHRVYPVKSLMLVDFLWCRLSSSFGLWSPQFPNLGYASCWIWSPKYILCLSFFGSWKLQQVL